MECCVVGWLLQLFTKYCPSGVLKDAGWALKNFGDVRGDFAPTKPFAWPFFLAFSVVLIFRFGDGDFWCCSPLRLIRSADAIVGSCCLN